MLVLLPSRSAQGSGAAAPGMQRVPADTKQLGCSRPFCSPGERRAALLFLSAVQKRRPTLLRAGTVGAGVPAAAWVARALQSAPGPPEPDARPPQPQRAPAAGKGSRAELPCVAGGRAPQPLPRHSAGAAPRFSLQISPEEYEKRGFSGAKELAAMFRFYALKPDRNVALTMKLNPKARTFPQWVMDNKAAL